MIEKKRSVRVLGGRRADGPTGRGSRAGNGSLSFVLSLAGGPVRPSASPLRGDGKGDRRRNGFEFSTAPQLAEAEWLSIELPPLEKVWAIGGDIGNFEELDEIALGV